MHAFCRLLYIPLNRPHSLLYTHDIPSESARVIMTDWVCYIITNNGSTYVGASTNAHRRLRQHNGDICGGAKYTTSRGCGWTHYCIVRGFQTKIQALQFEWAVKHAAPRRLRGLPGRTVKLSKVIRRERWTKRSPLSSSVKLSIECYEGIPRELENVPDYITVVSKSA